MLGGLIGLEAPEQRFLVRGLAGLPQPPVAEHQIVVRLHILRIDGKNLLDRHDGFLVAAVEEQDPADLVRHNAVARILLTDPRQAL